MYEVTYVVNGIQRTLTVNATDGVQAQNIITNMFGTSQVQIISYRKI